VRRLVVTAVAAGAVLAGGVGSAAANPTAAGATRMTLYSVAIAQQFMNTQDDRQRGVGSNPFGNYKDITPTTKPKTNRPYPGDYTLLSFDIFGNDHLKKRVGKATLTCQFAFEQRAICKAVYELDEGTINGVGVVDFTKPRFALVVTGGSGTYFGRKGDVSSKPAVGGKAQQLDFVLG
jgi:hypothetical protein